MSEDAPELEPAAGPNEGGSTPSSSDGGKQRWSVSRWIVAHFDAHRKRTKFDFLWRVSLEGLVVPLVFAAALDPISHFPNRTDLSGWSPFKLLAAAVIVGPFFETVLLQALPVMVARRCGLSFWKCVAVSLILFAAAHLPSGVPTFIVAGILSGFYITFTYVHWRTTSFRSALWMTCGTHALHNLAIVSIALFAPA